MCPKNRSQSPRHSRSCRSRNNSCKIFTLCYNKKTKRQKAGPICGQAAGLFAEERPCAFGPRFPGRKGRKSLFTARRRKVCSMAYNQRRLHRLRHLRRCLPGGCHFGRRRQVCDRCGRVPGLRHLRRRVPRKRNQRRLTLHTKKENGRVRFCAPASLFPQSTIHAGGWAPARVAKLTLWAFGRLRRARLLKNSAK